jgi:hypothetical protein
LTITLIGFAIVFGAYFLWSGFREWFDERNQTEVQDATEAAQATATEVNRPTFRPFPSHTPVPACQPFYVHVNAANIRRCPSRQCETKDTLPYESEICVYGRALSSIDEPLADEWFEIDLNPDGVFRDLGYMHESVIRAVPTPRPTITNTPLPTITLTPSDTPLPTSEASATLPDLPTSTAQPSPTITPSTSAQNVTTPPTPNLD